jgi:arylsulfatase A-like enzyme
MKRRSFLKAGAAAPLLARGAAAAASGRPHILLLMADQHRADCLGAYGNKEIFTPHMDSLARGGVLFQNAYSSTPSCTPARAALLTGLSPWSHGMLGYGQVAEKYPAELPQLLRDSGYYTAGIGKMHWTPQRARHGFHHVMVDESGREESADFRSDYRSWFWSEAPLDDPDSTGLDWNGYEAWPYKLPEHLHPTAWIGDTAVKFLQDYQKPQPFFLKVSFERPHSPYDPPARWMDHYEGSLPPAANGNWDGKYKPRSSNGRDIWHGDLGADAVRRARQGYYGSVSFVDEQIGRVLGVLKERGWLDNTLVMYLSDHGDMLGDHHMWRKAYPYESSARVPLIIHWPRGLGAETRGVKLQNPVEIRDVMPTFADAAGATVPGHVEGMSLLKLARNPNAEWRPWIDLEHDVTYSKDNHWNALTDGRSKYIFHAKNGEEQLFDLVHDRAEEKDLSKDPSHQDQLKFWRDRLMEHLSKRGAPWVVKGALGLRPDSILYSPNYPRRA